MIVGRSNEAQLRQNDSPSSGLSIGRSKNLLRPRVWFLQRGHIDIWETETIHQEDKAGKEGMKSVGFYRPFF